MFVFLLLTVDPLLFEHLELPRTHLCLCLVGKNARNYQGHDTQLVASGCYDLVDIIGWQDIPEKWKNHQSHAHNRLLTSIVLNHDERTTVARAHSTQLAKATGKTALLLPKQGLGEWDRIGADLHDKEGRIGNFFIGAHCHLPRSG